MTMGNSKSGVKELNNGLPKGSVLAPFLFSLYVADINNTQSGSSDVPRTGQEPFKHQNFEADIEVLERYFRK